MYTLMSGGPIGYYVCMLNVCMINVCMLMCTRRFESQTNNIHKHLYAYFMYCMCTMCINICVCIYVCVCMQKWPLPH